MTDQAAIQVFRNFGFETRLHFVNCGFTYAGPNGVVRKHEFGWPDTSIAAAAREGGITGGSSACQHFAEVYTPESLEVRRALDKITYPQRMAFKAKWVYEWKYAKIARNFQIRRQSAFELVGRANDAVWRVLAGDLSGGYEEGKYL